MGLWATDSLHNCAACRKDGLQQSRGCPEISGEHPNIWFEWEGKTYRHCLIQEVTAQSISWINEFNFIEAGILPEAGGLNNQYEIDLQAFSIVADEKAAVEAAKRHRK